MTETTETQSTAAALAEAQRDLSRIASQRKPLPSYSKVKAARAKVADLKAQLAAEEA